MLLLKAVNLGKFHHLKTIHKKEMQALEKMALLFQRTRV